MNSIEILSGFTILELLVSLTIFVYFAASGSAIFSAYHDQKSH